MTVRRVFAFARPHRRAPFRVPGVEQRRGRAGRRHCQLLEAAADPSWCASSRRASDCGVDVTLRTVPEGLTAIVPETTTWAEYPTVWPRLLDEVWAFIRAGGATKHGHNVMLYRDDVPHVEVGVQVAEPFVSNGRVVQSTLPAGTVATAINRGPYEGLAQTHGAIHAWCAAHGHLLTGVRWEIYGDPSPGSGEVDVEVNYLLYPSSASTR